MKERTFPGSVKPVHVPLPTDQVSVYEPEPPVGDADTDVPTPTVVDVAEEGSAVTERVGEGLLTRYVSVFETVNGVDALSVTNMFAVKIPNPQEGDCVTGNEMEFPVETPFV